VYNPKLSGQYHKDLVVELKSVVAILVVMARSLYYTELVEEERSCPDKEVVAMARSLYYTVLAEEERSWYHKYRSA